ncbi:MAG: hypothetical protein IKN77_12005 [Paludibacteraceae bacterium]|nr:hypothetical protein [Paludibacteraceae bacterium]
MKKLFIFLFLIPLCSCGGKQDKDGNTAETTTVELEEETMDSKGGGRTYDTEETEESDRTAESPSLEKAVSLIDTFHANYGPASSKSIETTINAYNNDLSGLTDSNIEEIKQYISQLSEGQSFDISLSYEVEQHLIFYKTITEYAEVFEMEGETSTRELIANEYEKWNKLTEKINDIGAYIMELNYFNGSMAGIACSSFLVSVAQVSHYNARVLKCCLSRNCERFKNGIPAAAAKEALLKTIDIILVRLDDVDGHNGESYANAYNKIKTGRDELVVLIDNWIRAHLALSGKVDHDGYSPCHDSIGVLLISLAEAINS